MGSRFIEDVWWKMWFYIMNGGEVLEVADDSTEVGTES